MNETKEKRRFKKAFLIMSSILLTFGIMAQILSEMMGYTPLLADYFLHLLPSVAAGFLGYYLMTRLRNGGKTGKVILAVFLIIVFAWSAFMIVMFADVQFDDYYQDETYGNGWYFGWANRKEEAQYMLSKCHLFGHGDAYYQYSDDLIDPEVWIIDDLPQDVAEDHHNAGHHTQHHQQVVVVVLGAFKGQCADAGIAKHLFHDVGAAQHMGYGDCHNTDV